MIAMTIVMRMTETTPTISPALFDPLVVVGRKGTSLVLMGLVIGISHMSPVVKRNSNSNNTSLVT